MATMTPTPTTPQGQKTEAGLSLRFLAVGLVAFCGVLWGLPFVADRLIAGASLAGPVLALIHLAALGWLTMVAVGATYQLMPVALGVKLRAERLARVTFWLLTAGVALMVAGFVGFTFPLLVPGAITVWTALALFLVVVAVTLRQIESWSVTGRYMTGAYTLLGVAMTLGFLIVAALHHGFSARLLTLGPGAHAFLAVFGWLVPLIVGVSYKLIPMFGLIHGHSEKLAGWNAWLVLGAPVGAGISLLAGWAIWPVFILMEAVGLSLFAYDVRRLMAQRMRKAPDYGLRFVSAGMVPLAGAAWAGTWAALGGPLPLDPAAFWTGLGVLVFLGGLSSVVLGYLHKIVPFLHWMDRYADKVGKGPVPRTQDLLNERVARVTYGAYQGTIALLAVALLSGRPLVLALACGLLAACGTAAAVNVLMVLRK